MAIAIHSCECVNNQIFDLSLQIGRVRNIDISHYNINDMKNSF